MAATAVPDPRGPRQAPTARRCSNGSPSRSSRTTASTSPSPPTVAAVGDRGDVRALALDQPRHRLVDRVGGEQVPGGDGVALADPVAAVLGLVVHRGGPLELEERDVGRAGERDPLGRNPGRADDQLRAARILEGGDRGLAIVERVAAEQVQRRPGSARARPAAPRRGARTRPAVRPRRGSRRSRRAPAASLPRAARRCSVPSCARRSARRVAAIRALSSDRSSGWVRSHSITSRSASRYSDSLVSAHRHDDLALGGQLRQHLGLQPPDEAAPAQMPVQPLLAELALGTDGRTARPTRSPPAGRSPAAGRSAPRRG